MQVQSCLSQKYIYISTLFIFSALSCRIFCLSCPLKGLGLKEVDQVLLFSVNELRELVKVLTEECCSIYVQGNVRFLNGQLSIWFLLTSSIIC
jgi:hypothetical protein